MTEKRFECDKGSRIIIDNETKLHYIMTLDWECSLVTKLLNHFADENEQLKISSTMYHNLFKELQRQMQGVKSIYDLDSKDFEDLIKLSKGNVFDDKIGWVHLPIEEL